MSDVAAEIARLREIVEQRKGAIEFVALAQLLGANPEQRAEAREICFRGLTANPDNHRGRLELARLFYQDGYIAFSLMQLEELRRRVKVPALERLISAFGSVGKGAEDKPVDLLKSEAVETLNVESSSQEVLAELDLDADVLEMYEEVTSRAK